VPRSDNDDVRPAPPGGVTWAPLGPDALDDVAALAAACLTADGGLPIAAEPWFLERRWGVPATTTIAARDAGGRVVAAGALRPGPSFTGMVHPSARGRGLGGRLLDWGLQRAADTVVVETETLTRSAQALFTSRGLRQIFAEHVMRTELTTVDLPTPTWPAGATIATWHEAGPDRFFNVYQAAFRERPGFPGWSAQQWIDFVADDDDFRPEWSFLVSLPEVGDAGFVTGGLGWIVQVGVRPDVRGRGLATALIRESLRRMRADGATDCWLDVTMDNPARDLYLRLGFEDRGLRARYRR
jgi:mycothiol synthase